MSAEWTTVVGKKKEKEQRLSDRRNQRQQRLPTTSNANHHDPKGAIHAHGKTSFSSKKAERRDVKLAEARAFAKSLNDDISSSQNHCDDEEEEEDGAPSLSLIGMVEGCMDALLPIDDEDGSKHASKSKVFDCESLLDSLRRIASSSPLHHETVNESDGVSSTRPSSGGGDTGHNNGGVREIVCYGIGNFDRLQQSSSSVPSASFRQRRTRTRYYEAPVVQLACVLVLRRELALEYLQHPVESTPQSSPDVVCDDKSELDSTARNESSSDDEDVMPALSYVQQQEIVPIYYYEPLMKQSELTLLTKYFGVSIIETNEWGKRCVAGDGTVRCEGDDGVGADAAVVGDGNSTPSSSVGDRADHGDTTLFYMPHCPMRLYSNVLWANWHPNLLLRRTHRRHTTHHHHRNDKHIVIFGNSLRAYDDRLSSVLQRRDDTDGILPLLPWIREEKPVVISSTVSDDFWQQRRRRRCRRRRAGIVRNGNFSEDDDGGGGCRYELSEQGLETAFNDCVMVYFSEAEEEEDGGGGSRVWPDRPREHFVMDDGDDELL